MNTSNGGPFRCPGCGSVTFGSRQYCSECGTHLYQVCPNCTSKWRYMYEYAFCPECGTKLPLAALGVNPSLRSE